MNPEPTTAHAGVLSLLTAKFGVPAQRLEDTSATLEQLGIDSIGLIELLLDLRKTLGARIGQGELSSDDTVAQTIALVGARVGETP